MDVQGMISEVASARANLAPGNRILFRLNPRWIRIVGRAEKRYAKKFKAGRQYIPTLFEGLALPNEIEQIALFAYGGVRTTLAAGRVMFIKDFMFQVREHLYRERRHVKNAAIPEEYPLLKNFAIRRRILES